LEGIFFQDQCPAVEKNLGGEWGDDWLEGRPFCWPGFIGGPDPAKGGGTRLYERRFFAGGTGGKKLNRTGKFSAGGALPLF